MRKEDLELEIAIMNNNRIYILFKTRLSLVFSFSIPNYKVYISTNLINNYVASRLGEKRRRLEHNSVVILCYINPTYEIFIKMKKNVTKILTSQYKSSITIILTD